MSKYIKFTDKKDAVRYRKDGKLFSPKNIPVNILQVLENNAIFDEEAPEIIAQSRQCIFCGAYSKYSRLLDSQSIALCDEHYYSESLGKVAQKVREIKDEKANAENG